MLTELLPKNIDRCKVDIWSQDETRVGQQGSLTRIWAKRGTRPRKVRQQQFISTYIYGAACHDKALLHKSVFRRVFPFCRKLGDFFGRRSAEFCHDI